MDDKTPLVPYALAAMSGLCFVSGLMILSGERSKMTCTDSRRSC